MRALIARAFLWPTLALLCLQAQTSPLDLLEMRTPPADLRVAYGNGASQFAELRVPQGAGPFPVAIVLHGGCWQARLPGFPAEATSLDLIRPLAAALTQAGFATWNVEYRRVGDSGGGWPGTFLDVGAATEKLRELAPRYHLDLARAIAVGHSSGGQLAEWLSTRAKISKRSDIYAQHPLPIAGVIDLDGPPTLVNPQNVVERVCGDGITGLTGGTFAEVPGRYRDGSVVVPSGVRQELFTTGGFGRAWADLTLDYAKRATEAGDRASVHTVDAADHFDIIDPESSYWPDIRKAAEALAGAH